MAQGKIKTKTNVSKPQGKKNNSQKNKGGLIKNNGGGVKKGKFSFTAKKGHQQQAQKFKKAVQKNINAVNELQIKASALKHHEGKKFHVINDNNKAAGSSKQ